MDIKTFNTVFDSNNGIILFYFKHANKTNGKIHFLRDDDVIILAQLLFNYNALSCQCGNNANTMNLLGFEIETVYYVPKTKATRKDELLAIGKAMSYCKKKLTFSRLFAQTKHNRQFIYGGT